MRIWPRSWMWVSSENESQLNSLESMLALLSSLIVSVIFHGGTGGQELVIDSEGSWAVGMFQVVDDIEISLIDADDLLPGGTARFGFAFCAWFRCPSCATAAFLLWVQWVAMS